MARREDTELALNGRLIDPQSYIRPLVLSLCVFLFKCATACYSADDFQRETGGIWHGVGVQAFSM